MRQILEKCWEQNTDVHQLFVDFRTVYDTVWREGIWSGMHKLGPPTPPQKKKVNLCKILNDEKYAKVKTDKHLSSEFKVNKGLRQGDSTVLLLFNVVCKLQLED